MDIDEDINKDSDIHKDTPIYQYTSVFVKISVENILNSRVRTDMSDRQTINFIELSIQAGILLGGNGALRSMLVAEQIDRRLARC